MNKTATLTGIVTKPVLRRVAAFMAAFALLSTAGCGKLWMSYRAFDETPGSGWRTLADEGEYLDAAIMIDSYAKRRRDMAPWQLVNLRFHAGQMYACAGDYETAAVRFGSALLGGGGENPHDRWNTYVRAHIAFVKGDFDGLRSSRDALAGSNSAGSAADNLADVDALMAHFGESYKDAYGALDRR